MPNYLVVNSSGSSMGGGHHRTIDIDSTPPGDHHVGRPTRMR